MGGQLRRPLTRARVTGVGVSLGGGLCLLWLSLSRSVETRKLNLCSLKSHVPCIPDVVERDLSFISSILSSPEGSGPVFYGPRRVNGSSKFRARGYAKALRDPVQVGESFRALYRRVSPYFVKKRSWVFMHFLTYGGFCCHPY